jgi:hypothetical protein
VRRLLPQRQVHSAEVEPWRNDLETRKQNVLQKQWVRKGKRKFKLTVVGWPQSFHFLTFVELNLTFEQILLQNWIFSNTHLWMKLFHECVVGILIFSIFHLFLFITNLTHKKLFFSSDSEFYYVIPCPTLLTHVGRY